jgi:hypothetical protein
MPLFSGSEIQLGTYSIGAVGWSMKIKTFWKWQFDPEPTADVAVGSGSK